MTDEEHDTHPIEVEDTEPRQRVLLTRSVETASAAPGEVRSLTHPRDREER